MKQKKQVLIYSRLKDEMILCFFWGGQMQSLYYLDLLQKELCAFTLDHLKLPVLHLAEAIALDLLQRSRLSELYRLR